MARKSKSIGFVDHKIDNWHTNTFLHIIRNQCRRRGYTVAGCTATQKRPGRTWAEKNNVPWFDSVADMNDHVDCYLVLAPDDPRTHLDLCKAVFPFAKTTYVDKTFAPDVATAKRIFALADKHRVKMQTTSALRHTAVQQYVHEVGRANLRHIVAWGGGRSFDVYAIHPVEMIVSCMGPKAVSLMRRGGGKQSQLLINYTRGRTAVANVYCGDASGFHAAVTTNTQTRHIKVDVGQLFVDMTNALLDFFDTGRVSIDRAESLMVRRILDVARNPRALKGFVKL